MKLRKDFGKDVSNWKVWLVWALRVVILASGIYQTFLGETAIGIVILITFALIVSPNIIFKKKNLFFPVEVEILLFFMVLLQFVVGEARDWYTNVPYYDKFVHFMLPMFLGLIGFLVIYTMQAMGNLKASLTTMAILIVMIAMAVGAGWEIFEYLSDELIYPRWPYHHFQGSLTEDPLHDTMNDLIMDTAGATVGALLGLYFIGRAQKKGWKRMNDLTEETTSWVKLTE